MIKQILKTGRQEDMKPLSGQKTGEERKEAGPSRGWVVGEDMVLKTGPGQGTVWEKIEWHIRE